MTHLINMSFGWSASLDFNYFSSMPRSVVVITSGLKSTYLWLTFRSINYGLGSLDAGFRAFYEFRIEKMAPLLAPCLVLQRVIQRFVGYFLQSTYLQSTYLQSTYLQSTYLPSTYHQPSTIYLPTYILATYLPTYQLPTYHLPIYHLDSYHLPTIYLLTIYLPSINLFQNGSLWCPSHSLSSAIFQSLPSR